MPLVAGILTTAVLVFAAGTAEAQARWQWPVRGPLGGSYRVTADPFVAGQHRGIDIAAAVGTAVRSACSGRVRFAGTVARAGRTVSVDCGRLRATYLHLGVIAVRAGRSVRRGARLGTVGTSGQPHSPGPHLHFGVRRPQRRWSYVDPLSLLDRGPDGPGPTVWPSAPRGVPSAPRLGPAPPALPVRVPRAAHARPQPAPSPAALGRPARAGGALPWPVTAGLALLAAGLPLDLLRRARRRERRRRVAASIAVRRTA